MLALDMLGVPEKMLAPAERQSRTQWVDGVFNQTKIEGKMDAWKRPITSGQGRCWLIVASGGLGGGVGREGVEGRADVRYALPFDSAHLDAGLSAGHFTPSAWLKDLTRLGLSDRMAH